MIRCAAITMLAMFVALGGGCQSTNSYVVQGATGSDDVTRRGQLVIGVDADSAPMCYDDGGTIRGTEADLGRMLAKELGLKPVFVTVPFSDLRGELSAGHIDIIMAGMSVTEARQRMVAFAQPYTHIGQRAIVRSADAKKYPTGESLDAANVRIAVENGTTGEMYARSAFKHAGIYALPSLDDAMAFLRVSKVDAVIHDSAILSWRAAQRPGAFALVPGQFTDEPIAWAVRKGNTALLSRVNQVLDRWKQQGVVDEVLDRWLGSKTSGSQ